MSKVDGHLCVFARSGSSIFILDAAEPKPIDMKKQKAKTLEWLTDLKKIRIFAFPGKTLPEAEEAPLLKEWNRVMNGADGGKRGRPVKEKGDLSPLVGEKRCFASSKLRVRGDTDNEDIVITSAIATETKLVN